MHICVLEESVQDSQSVDAAQLQKDSSVIINVSITVSQITTLHTRALFPTSALKFPKRIVDSLVLTLRGTSVISFTNFGYSTLEFGPYACIKHRERPNNFNLNMYTLPSSRIHSFTKFSVCRLSSIRVPA